VVLYDDEGRFQTSACCVKAKRFYVVMSGPRVRCFVMVC